MDSIIELIEQLNSIVWGWPMLILILGVSMFLSLGLKLMSILKVGSAFKLMWHGRKSEGEGEIPPYQANPELV
ncbi:hypothetical protein ACPV4B_09630 [Vibrio parahaemolyticus]